MPIEFSIENRRAISEQPRHSHRRLTARSPVADVDHAVLDGGVLEGRARIRIFDAPQQIQSAAPFIRWPMTWTAAPLDSCSSSDKIETSVGSRSLRPSTTPPSSPTPFPPPMVVGAAVEARPVSCRGRRRDIRPSQIPFRRMAVAAARVYMSRS